MKNSTIKNVFWSLSDNFLQQIINFGVGIILARLLSPSEFGLIGIVIVFIAISSTFIDSGLSSALINEKKADKYDYNTVFWTNIILGVVFFILLYFISPFIALFFKLPELTSLLRISSISLIFLSLSSIQRTIYVKDLNFKIITWISLISVVISAIVAIYMALKGYGVLSLVVRSVLGQFVTMLLFWSFSKWRPSFIFDLKVLIKMYSYGVNLFLTSFLNTIHNNLYYVIIGKYFSPATLGFYTRANTFKDLASVNISNAIKRVSFSSLSRIDNLEEQELHFSDYVNPTILATSFLMSILLLCAEPIVLILLGEKWINSILMLKIIALSGVFLPIYSLNLNYLAVKRYTGVYLKVEILSKLLIFPVVIIGIYWGFISLLYAIVIHSLIIYLLSILSLKYFNLLYKYQLKNISLCLSSIIILYIFQVFISRILIINNMYIVLFLTLFLITLYWFAFTKFFNKTIYENIVKLLKKI